jgi:hypothetical protein
MVLEKTIPTCARMLSETKLMQLQVENDLHDDEELQSELRHALDIVLIDEHENVEMSSQSIVSPMWLM